MDRRKLNLDVFLYEDSHDGIVVSDSSGNIIHINKLFTKIFEFDKAICETEKLAKLIEELEKSFGKNPLLTDILKYEIHPQFHKARIKVEVSSNKAVEIYSFNLSHNKKPIGRVWRIHEISKSYFKGKKELELIQSLRYRSKVMNCLNEVENIFKQVDISDDERYTSLVYLIPSAWLDPGVVEARIDIWGKQYCTNNFTENKVVLNSMIHQYSEMVGEISISLGDFIETLDKERIEKEAELLVNSIIEKLSHFLEISFTQKKLKESEVKFRNVFQSSNSAIIILDSDSNITFYNSQVNKMFKYDVIDNLNFVQDLIDKEHQTSIKETIVNLNSKFQDPDSPIIKECVGVDGEKNKFPIEISFSVWYNEEDLRITCAINDITARKNLEVEKIKQEKLAGAIEMAGATCHEINQPLQIISGYSELLEFVELSTDARHKVEVIKENIDRLKEITDKLQKITKYETLDYVDNSKIIDIDKSSKNK